MFNTYVRFYFYCTIQKYLYSHAYKKNYLFTDDSGGPLVTYRGAQSKNPVLVGVVSWGFECGKANFPGVYSRVSIAREWIYENTGI